MYKECLYCGESYEPKNSQQKYCSKECGRRYLYYNRTFTFVCQGCGKEYQAKEKNRNQYCSRGCAYEHQRDWHGNSGVTCVVCGIEYVGVDGYSNEYCTRSCRDRAYTTICESCGVEFVGSVINQKRCYGDDCERAWAKRMHQEKYTPVSETNPYVTKVCAHCGDTFQTNIYADGRIYCPGTKCADRAYRQSRSYRARTHKARVRRRKRIRKPDGAPRVYRAKVFKRDGWICQICGEPVDRKLQYPHPQSATLDHVVPLARGGVHEPSNCQLAHMICNSTKRDMLPEEVAEVFASD